MATSLPPATTQHLQLRNHSRRRRVSPYASSFPPPLLTSLVSFYTHGQELSSINIRTQSFIPHLHRSSLRTVSSHGRSSGGRCGATSPGPPSPPKLDPPPGENPPPSSGFMSSFSRAQDAVRIFFAVLFWMSLFFWSCVWDGKNDGRPNNRSRFRR